MRADLDGATLTYTPKAVDGDPIISTTKNDPNVYKSKIQELTNLSWRRQPTEK